MELAVVSPGEKNGAEGGALQVVTQVVGLLAGLATVVYATGAIVLALRLKFELLPWGNVVSQLPREFLLSVGAGQVLIPALAIGAGYGLLRLLFRRGRLARDPARLRDEGNKRREAILGYLSTFAAMLVPTAVVLGFRLRAHRGLPLHHLTRNEVVVLCLGFAVFLLFAAIVARESRAALFRIPRGVRTWSASRQAAVVAGLCAVFAIPAMIAAAACVPFTEAKACTVDGYEERGLLVGETSDRIYLGELSELHRRLAVLPLSKVEETFIGDEAWEATCEYPSDVVDTPDPDEADGGDPLRGPRNSSP
jgi:hypothetical protein